MGLLEDAITSGDTQAQARLSPLFEEAQYNARLSSGLPPGAVYDRTSPKGFSIADPRDLERYVESEGKLARGLAGQNYMDAFYRDRHRNTMEVMKSIHGLDPDLQALVLDRLGIRPKVVPQSIEGMSPTNAWALQHGYAPDASAGATGSYIPGMGQGLGGGSKLRNDLMKIKYNYDLGAGDRADNLAIRQLQAMATAQRAQSDEEYKVQQNNFRDQQLRNQRLGLVKEIGSVVSQTEQQAQMGNPEAVARLPNLRKLHNQLVLEATMSELKDVTGGSETPWWNMEGAFGAQPPTGAPQRGRTAAPPSAIPSAPGDLQGGWGAARSRPAAGRRGGSVTRIE